MPDPLIGRPTAEGTRIIRAIVRLGVTLTVIRIAAASQGDAQAGCPITGNAIAGNFDARPRFK